MRDSSEEGKMNSGEVSYKGEKGRDRLSNSKKML